MSRVTGSFVFMFGEDKSFATSLYWAIVTSSTVGYGDVVPTTDGACVYVCVYVFIKLHITAQSGPVILVIVCHSH